jgi:hypothetical protein
LSGWSWGGCQDFTAISVLERVEARGEWDPVMFAYPKTVVLHPRHLQRIPIGTTYLEVVSQLGELVRSPELDGCCELLADATGVGRSVVDLLRMAQLNCTIKPEVVTGGVDEQQGAGYYHVPKRDLITRLVVALQSGRLQIAQGMEHCPELLAEMAEIQVKVTPQGNEQFGTWREGAHDDLVFAVAAVLLGRAEGLSVRWVGEVGLLGRGVEGNGTLSSTAHAAS